MPRISTQKEFQTAHKPDFCYLCGKPLQDGQTLNSDHCPPEKIFAVHDRANYPIKLQVHKKCNHSWHLADEKLSIFFDVLHGAEKASNPEHVKKLTFLSIPTDQGVYQGLTRFPFKALVVRIVRCVHALLYSEFLPRETMHHFHFPIPEVNPQKGNEPIMHEMQTYAFSNALCTALKTETFDCIYAYNNEFKYVCTWSALDNGEPICIFAFDIYRLSKFAVKIKDFPEAIIGFYAHPCPENASIGSKLVVENTDKEILYPLSLC